MEPGLCGGCRHCQVVETPRSVFYLCRRSFTDPRFRKYPALPVRVCSGYEEGSPDRSRPPSVTS
jgi:hypothetical protein